MIKVKLSQLAKLTDEYSYSNNTFELKITEENGEKYIEITERDEINKDRIEELETLIKQDKEGFQNSVNKYIVTLDYIDGIMVGEHLKKLRYHVHELNLLKEKTSL